MSWDPYVTSLHSAGFHHACLGGHDGRIWAASHSFRVHSKELRPLVAALSKTPGALEHLQLDGFELQRRGYAFIRCEEIDDDIAVLVGRCKQYGSAVRGVIAAMTQRTIVVGIHNPVFANGLAFGQGMIGVCELADSLVSMGF